MAKLQLALVTPGTINGTVQPGQPPRRRPNADTRAREYLTDAEVQKLMKAAGGNRNGHRDATMVLLAYRHGLRPIELVTLRWDAIDFADGQIHVSRAKNGSPSVHPLSGVELRALRRLKRDQETPSPFVFTSERKMVARRSTLSSAGPKVLRLDISPSTISTVGTFSSLAAFALFRTKIRTGTRARARIRWL